MSAVTGLSLPSASIAQLVEHALRKRMVRGSIPRGGFIAIVDPVQALTTLGRRLLAWMRSRTLAQRPRPSVLLLAKPICEHGCLVS
jgi:hypothetical protein